MNNEYKKALSEVNEVINNSDKKIQKKIPEKFKQFIKDNMDKNYVLKIDCKIELVKQPISTEAKEILALIYKMYIL